MTTPCTQEENIGFIKGKIEEIFNRFVVLDKRLNGSFNQMTTHVSESAKHRATILKHEIYFKWLACILTMMFIPITVFVVKEIISHITIQ